jgi:5-methylthioadenosine/S-adenosylhomocysteine deaminase
MSENLSRPGFLRASGAGLLAGATTIAATTGNAGAADSPDRLLIKNGHVLTLDKTLGDFDRADVLVERGKIVDIRPNITAGAQVIDASNAVVMPGFIDTHRHMWEGLMRNLFPDLSYPDYFKFVLYGVGPAYRPQDVYAGNYMSALGALNAGITTILDFSHIQNSPEHTDAAIKALHDSGLRAVFGYGYPTNGAQHWWTEKRDSKYPEDLFRIRKQYFNSDDQLLTVCLAAEGPPELPQEVVLSQWKAARDAGVRISVHAGSAGKRGFYEQYASIPGFFGADTTYIHCCAFSELEWKLVADSGGTVSISPGSEMPMGHGMSAIQTSLDHGIRPSLSVDVETTEPGDFFTTIRLTLYLQRQLINLRALAGEKNLPKWLTAHDVLELASIEGARACGLDRKTGTLTVGKDADMILVRTDMINVIPFNNAVGLVSVAADTSNVDTVIVRGKVLKQNGRLIGVDMNRLSTMVGSSRDYVLARARVLQQQHGN